MIFISQWLFSARTPSLFSELIMRSRYFEVLLACLHLLFQGTLVDHPSQAGEYLVHTFSYLRTCLQVLDAYT